MVLRCAVKELRRLVHRPRHAHRDHHRRRAAQPGTERAAEFVITLGGDWHARIDCWRHQLVITWQLPEKSAAGCFLDIVFAEARYFSVAVEDEPELVAFGSFLQEGANVAGAPQRTNSFLGCGGGNRYGFIEFHTVPGTVLPICLHTFLAYWAIPRRA